ncbi:MAG TPA: hypothetical protein VIM99_13490 [Blastocatellia bacterium]
MPRETLSTSAPLSAAGSAAQTAGADVDHSGAFIGSAEADRVRPKLRVVAGGAPVIEPAVESASYPVAARLGGAGGEVLAEDWAKDWAEDESDSPPSGPAEARAEARLDDGGSRAPFLTVVEKKSGKAKPQSAIRGKSRTSGLKKLSKKQAALDWPPTPRGCEWRRTEDGLNLWRCWTDWDEGKTRRIKKSRYAGHLSDDAWRIMKEYDHEAFISIVGERLRRHSGR